MAWTRRGLLQAAGVAALGLGGWGWAEARRLRVERVQVPIPGLPPGLEGLRIAQLTDIHVGHWAGPERAEQAVAAANGLSPDLAVFTGDLIHSGAALGHLEAAAAALGRLRAPLGAWAVLGNHDHWASTARPAGERERAAAADRVQGALEAAGVPVLRNRGVALARGGGSLWLAGLDDAWAGRPEPDAALAGAPAAALRVVLVHEPDYADALARLGRPVHLQLSGHSHGGQIRLPGLGAPVLPYLGRKYPLGLARVPGSDLQVYTSRGIGVTGPPVRFLCPPEVTLLELVPRR